MEKMNTNPKQREFFNEHAAHWDNISIHDIQKVRRIVSLLELSGNERILDIGTGTGIMIPFYEENLRSGSILAIDYSENMIKQAMMKYPETIHNMVRYKVVDIYDMEMDEKFDDIVCYSCFPHFPYQERAIRILASYLEKDGKLMIAHSSSKKHINEVHRSGGEVISNDFLPKIEDLRDMIINAGLKPIFEQDDEDFYIIIGKF
ncbi:MAG: class I SAM-dependent methyltransferase [Candidatus Methanogranum gryphiswaldense]|nr:MAG: class I SAM-dependent methyltransferase [Candidatus Methanogranum sp. U3.2.1]